MDDVGAAQAAAQPEVAVARGAHGEVADAAAGQQRPAASGRRRRQREAPVSNQVRSETQ